MSLAKDPDFKIALYAGIEKAFDGDKNILIKDLSAIKTKGGIIGDKLTQTLSEILGDETKASQALTAFDNVNGENYYSQVFIPFYDELKEAGKIGNEEPVMVVFVEHKSVFPGYHIENGLLKETNFLVDEAYAMEHEVWVLSINERVDQDGNIAEDLSIENRSGRTQGTYFPNGRFEWIKCSVHKEEWVAGGSEVNIKRYKSFFTYDQYNGVPHSEGLTAEDAVSDGYGWRIYTFTRNDVSTAKKINRQWLYVSNWPTLTTEVDNQQFPHTDFLYYVIFEYDAWPTGLRTAGIADAGNSGFFIDTEYRSADVYYQKGFIPEASANFWQLSIPGGFWAESWY